MVVSLKKENVEAQKPIYFGKTIKMMVKTHCFAIKMMVKWKNKDIWYKADSTRYEGLTEYVISNLLLKSTLKKDEFEDGTYVDYTETIFLYR